MENFSCTEKQEKIIALFEPCATNEEKYIKIIEIGRALPPLPSALKTPELLVEGCQGALYLHSCIENDLILFQADAEALISRGLAALLINVYSQEKPETLFKLPPLFLSQIGIPQALSPSRSNGLASLWKKMQTHAARYLSIKSK